MSTQNPNPSQSQIPNPQKAPKPQISLEEKLRLLLQQMRDWERKKVMETSNVTVELIKLPKRETKKRIAPERLALQVKLSNSFRGILIDSIDVLEELIKVLNSEKVRKITEALEKLNGTTATIELEL